MNFILFIFYFLSVGPSNDTHTLTINITNIETVKGTLEIGLFNSGERFLEEGQALKTISVKVKSGSETVIIEDLPKGTYAISMYHDENADGECNRNFLGIPTEPYGFSNNFRPRFAAPTFKDCQFYLESNKTLKIKLKG
ncbi:DUF2141 domain-containing protein [Aequorivita lipolytica]|uniref:DUF2141 domain-containing protein n=1 Tax=Aequorivita lipolytica TaxID=153267 RepID=A0A5C6YRH3_9FLAO|nr:DUF2141 domain-containing protein [Aequorivita lipolytica]TXD70118.1 DUF2141 domain-containing protein [Aequorivita lipolytica]SRX50530.1 hypothetical protein AEQU2_01003 [Aequorivita lipolytica]